MTATTTTTHEAELAGLIGKALTGDPEHVVPAVQLLAAALATDAYCDRDRRREHYPSAGSVATFARRVVDPTVPGNTARVSIMLAAAQRLVGDGLLLPKDARLEPLKDGVYRVGCGWGWDGRDGLPCTGVLGTLWPAPDGWEMKQHAEGRHLRRERFAIRPGRSDRSVCPVCRRPNTIVPPAREGAAV
jgi:hypothetical protein